MTDIRAAFFDIDGTLTSFNTHRIPDSTIQSLRELQERDIRIIICTGRAPSFMSVVLDTIPVKFDGIVGLNGQYVTDGDGTLIERQPLLESDVRTIIAWLDEHPDVVASFCEQDFVYFNHSSEQLDASFGSLGKTAPTRYYDDPHERSKQHTIYQISPYISKEQEQDLLSHCQCVESVRWAPGFGDFVYDNGGKGHGLRRMMEHYGLDASQAIAFGDGGNDIAMLETAGIGVAMGNAADEVKPHADYVTDDVDHDGIRNALIHFGILE